MHTRTASLLYGASVNGASADFRVWAPSAHQVILRLTGRGDGSVIGGVISLRLAPDLLSLLAAGRQVVLVTGTNGKTTTTKLITAALAPLGGKIASNIYGANMEAGLTSALSRAPDALVTCPAGDEPTRTVVIARRMARIW